MCLNNSDNNSGFSLLEILLAVIVVGILAAITVPNLIGLLNQIRVTDGFYQLRGAIKESQRQAKRRGKQCKILIDEINHEVNISPPDANGSYTNCLLNKRTLPNGVLVKSNRVNRKITFSPKGNTNSARTIVVYSPNTQTKKCLVISLGLGIMRSGNYKGDVNNSVRHRHCETTGS